MKSTSPEAPETGPHPKITSGDLKVISGHLGPSRAASESPRGISPRRFRGRPRWPEMTRDEIDVARVCPRRFRTPKSPRATSKSSRVISLLHELRRMHEGVAKTDFVSWKGSGPKRLVCRKPGSGQIQCTPWRDHTPFTTSTFIYIHASAQAWGTAGDRQWVRNT